MNRKRLLLWLSLLAALVVCLACSLLFSGVFSENDGHRLIGSAFSVEEELTDGIKSKEDILTFITTINFLAGRRNVGNVRIGDGRLLVHPSVVDNNAVEHNCSFLETFYPQAESRYLMLVPDNTQLYGGPASFTSDFFSAKAAETDIYNRLQGKLIGIEGVTALSSVKNEYVLYRTQEGLTYRGGYYLYKAFAARTGLSTPTLDSYDVDILSTDYYGDLSKQIHFYRLEPDIVGVVSPRNRDIYSHIYYKDRSDTFLSGLYDRRRQPSALVSGVSAMEVTTGREGDSLLLIADEYGWQILPYLTEHYGQIVMVRPDTMSYLYRKVVEEKTFTDVLTVVGIDSFVSETLFSGLHE